MAKSILQDEKKCYVTRFTTNLHKHHVFGGSNRKKSEKYGLWIWLRVDWHNLQNYGIHFDKVFDLEVKQMAQTKIEGIWAYEIYCKRYLNDDSMNAASLPCYCFETYQEEVRERFIKEFGRSWL